jgi:hypothetical protein
LLDATDALNKGNKVTVILASDEASFLVQQATKGQAEQVYAAFDKIVEEPESLYTYSTPDIDGAMKLAEQITAFTDNVSVTLYTDTNYAFTDKVTIVNDFVDPTEWNAAILDVRAAIVENYYRVEIDVAAYAVDMRLSVYCEIMNANGSGNPVIVEKDVICTNDEVTTLVYGFVSDDMPEAEAARIDENIAVYSYEQIYVNVKAHDSLEYDNTFCLYGGEKPTLKVQYYSALKNDFYPVALMVLQDAYRDKWNIEITEVDPRDPNSEKLVLEGFDLYIFEHMVPEVIPDDGIVILTNPDKMPASTGVSIAGKLQAPEAVYFEKDEDHPLLKNLKMEEIYIREMVAISNPGDYTVLATCGGYPSLLVKEDVDQKVVLMPFSLHYTNMAMLPEFPLLLNNVISHFFPVTLEEYVYEINDTVKLNARSDYLDVNGPGVSKTFQEFPAELKVVTPGSYTLTQTPMSGEPVVENIYVKIPAEESDINLEAGVLTNPYFHSDADDNNIDLLFYFALALVALLLIEWWLKSREET